jgi:hypothetical protein
MKNNNDNFLKAKNVEYYKNAHAIGTDGYYKTISRILLFTDGVKAMAEDLECFWAIDVVVSYTKKFKDDFMSAYFILNNGGCDFYLTDGNDNVIVYQKIPFTDLTQNINLFVSRADSDRYVLMLPSEY